MTTTDTPARPVTHAPPFSRVLRIATGACLVLAGLLNGLPQAVVGLLAGVAGVVLVLGGSWWAGALVGAGAVVAATLGDLVESVLKRDLGIKDMGSVIPGHGGVLDRLDSLLLSAPVTWLLLGALVPVAI